MCVLALFWELWAPLLIHHDNKIVKKTLLRKHLKMLKPYPKWDAISQKYVVFLIKTKVIGVWSNHGVEYFRGPASPRVFAVDGRLFFYFFPFFLTFYDFFFDIFPQCFTHTLHWAIDCEPSWACWTSEVFYTVITSDTYHFAIRNYVEYHNLPI